MKKSIFKYTRYENEERYRGANIIFALCEEVIQSWAEQQIHRELSQKELYRLYWEFTDSDDLAWEIECAIRDAAIRVSSDDDGQWVGIDKEFEDEVKAGNIRIDTKIKKV